MHGSQVHLEVVGARVRASAERAGDGLAALVANLLVTPQVGSPTEQGPTVATGVGRRAAAGR